MYRSQSRITASNPSRLIKRLCNHWRHKFPVQLDEQGGDIELPLGRCSLRANEGVLDARLESTDRAQLQQLQKVVADHLARMAGVGVALGTEFADRRAQQRVEARGQARIGLGFLAADAAVLVDVQLGPALTAVATSPMLPARSQPPFSHDLEGDLRQMTSQEDDTVFTVPMGPVGPWDQLSANEKAWIEFIRAQPLVWLCVSANSDAFHTISAAGTDAFSGARLHINTLK